MLDVFKMKKLGILQVVFIRNSRSEAVIKQRCKKVYTNCTAAVLRAKDSVMKTASTVQENAEDILAEAKQINEESGKRSSS